MDSSDPTNSTFQGPLFSLRFAIHPRPKPRLSIADRIVVAIRENINVKVAIAVEVTEGRHVAGVHDVQAERLGRFLEVARPVIQIQQVGSVIITDIDVQITVIVDVAHRRTDTPRRMRVEQTGFSRDIIKLQLIALPIESVVSRSIDQVHIRKAIHVDVANRDASTTGSRLI